MQQLVDFHPSSTERIADIIPTIKSSESPEVAISTNSKYFEEEVEWCRYFFSPDWKPGHTISQRESCDVVAGVLGAQIRQIRWKLARFDGQVNNLREGEYYMDAAIGILEIGLSMLERTKRLDTPKDPCVEVSCQCQVPVRSPAVDVIPYALSMCPVDAHFLLIDLAFRRVSPFGDQISRDSDSDSEGIGSEDDEDDSDSEVNESEYEYDEDVIRDWVIAIGYATPDGSPHAIRSVFLKYVDLPPMLPHLGPNDEPEDIRPRWLLDAFRAVDHILEDRRIPERKIEVVPDIAGISI